MPSSVRLREIKLSPLPLREQYRQATSYQAVKHIAIFGALWVVTVSVSITSKLNALFKFKNINDTLEKIRFCTKIATYGTLASGTFYVLHAKYYWPRTKNIAELSRSEIIGFIQQQSTEAKAKYNTVDPVQCVGDFAWISRLSFNQLDEVYQELNRKMKGGDVAAQELMMFPALKNKFVERSIIEFSSLIRQYASLNKDSDVQLAIIKASYEALPDIIRKGMTAFLETDEKTALVTIPDGRYAIFVALLDDEQRSKFFNFLQYFSEGPGGQLDFLETLMLKPEMLVMSGQDNIITFAEELIRRPDTNRINNFIIPLHSAINKKISELQTELDKALKKLEQKNGQRTEVLSVQLKLTTLSKHCVQEIRGLKALQTKTSISVTEHEEALRTIELTVETKLKLCKELLEKLPEGAVVSQYSDDDDVWEYLYVIGINQPAKFFKCEDLQQFCREKNFQTIADLKMIGVQPSDDELLVQLFTRSDEIAAKREQLNTLCVGLAKQGKALKVPCETLVKISQLEVSAINKETLMIAQNELHAIQLAVLKKHFKITYTDPVKNA